MWFTAVATYLLLSTSGKASNFALKAFETGTGLALTVLSQDSGFSYHYDGLFGQPYSLGTALSYFDLDPELQDYASCPECSKLHTITNGHFEERCVFKDFHGQVCNEPLGVTTSLKNGGTLRQPIRRYQHQRVAAWIGNLLSRGVIEDAMDKAAPSRALGGKVKDIWQAEFVHQLRHENKPFWIVDWIAGGRDTGRNEGRYLFGLAVDSFNAHHSVAAKKTWSVGAIFLVCYNLPVHLRFRRENICLVGIIPGPKQPTGQELNHFLQPMVNDLISLWTTGVWLSRTSRYPTGRLVRAALGPVICDLAASRPLSGFTAHNAYRFCSRCLLHLHDIAHTIIHAALTPRDPQTHRELAYIWLGAPSTQHRTILEQDTGVKWTILLELEYWDPIACTVVDVMHNGFLGNFETHIRDVWGQDLKHAGGDASNVIHRLPPDAATQQRITLVLQAGGGNDALKNFDVGTLESACWDRNLGVEIGPNPIKAVMIEGLLNLVRDSDSVKPFGN